MKLNVTKKLASLFLSVLLTLGSLFSIKCFAELNDIGIIGGSYGYLREIIKNYKSDHPKDQTEYECHHLIAKEALNRWRDEIYRRGLANRYNEFLVKYLDQNWAPSITMEKADHEKTRSYFYKNARTNDQKEQNGIADNYIKWQADQIINYGDIIGVLKKETKFIKETFGDKYDEALDQVWDYINSLNFRHPDRRHLSMVNPENPRLYFTYEFPYIPARFARA